MTQSTEKYTQPCEIWTDASGRNACGQPASLGMPSEFGMLTPICDDCIAWTGNKRRYLKRITPDNHPAIIEVDE